MIRERVRGREGSRDRRERGQRDGGRERETLRERERERNHWGMDKS